MNKNSIGKAIGGKARAKSLSPSRRKDIAQKAAQSRWNKDIKIATHGSIDHPLVIGDTTIPCYVLNDGTRVLSQRGLQAGMGMSLSGGKIGEQRLAVFMDNLHTKGIDIKDLAARIRNPIEFRPPVGGRSAYGYEATILADICDVVLSARKNNSLHLSQAHYADQCEILVRGFARVGIIALVDEATGFQKDRTRRALADILEAFVAKEIQPWVKSFPSEFYEELFRLRGLDYAKDSVKRPQYFGHLTNDIIYKRLAPAVLAELKKATKKDAKGRNKTKLHQQLTTDIGHPRLREHIAGVIPVMKLASNYNNFRSMLDRTHPLYNETLPLAFKGENDDAGEGI